MSALVDVRAMLVPPAVHESALVVPAEWRTWDWYFQRARDAINDFCSLVDKLPGVDVGRLPEGSLAELVVMPFCGDWDRIAARADGCVVAARAMDGLAVNVAAAPLALGRDWAGLASASAVAHVGCYAVATRGMAEVVAGGREAFRAVALMSRRLGETAIRLLVPLGRLLVRLAARLATRFGGWVAWVRSAKDVVEDGLGPVRDIYDDVRHIVTLVDDLLALRSLVEAWVAEAREALGTMRSLPDLLDGLPRLGLPGSGGEVRPPPVPGPGPAAGLLDDGLADAAGDAGAALAELRR